MDFKKMSEDLKNPTRFEKFATLNGRTLLVGVITYVLILYIYLWVMEKYGFDRAVISLLIIILLTLRDMLKVMSK